MFHLRIATIYFDFQRVNYNIKVLVVRVIVIYTSCFNTVSKNSLLGFKFKETYEINIVNKGN